MKRLWLNEIFLCLILSLPCVMRAQTGQWVWLAGDSAAGAIGSYGTIGVSSPLNKPGARYEGGGEWMDKQGKFWHFGGDPASGARNDMWKFDPVTNQWTWMHGSTAGAQAGNYGMKGVAAASNVPGARAYASFTWTDAQGNFWLFGGEGAAYYNDLWKYDPNTNMWTWVSGTSLSNQSGTYGTKGLASKSNVPGGRSESDAAWVDAAGNFWLFGGFGYDGYGKLGFLNDLWKYDPLNDTWTWMSGNKNINGIATYGIQGLAQATNEPGARMQFASWKDNNGNFWMFGSNGPGGSYDDLWKYDPLVNMWTWMKGTNGPGNPNGTYGTQCVPSASNNPPALSENRARWTDDCGNLWMLSGFYSNSLWRYNIGSNQWVWVSGSSSSIQNAVYGKKGIPASINHPGGRGGAMAYRRDTTNEFCFFGGLGYDYSNQVGKLNDFWKYIPGAPKASYTWKQDPFNPCLYWFLDTSDPNCNEMKSRAWYVKKNTGPWKNFGFGQLNPSYLFAGKDTFYVRLVVLNCTGMRDTTQQMFVVNCGGGGGGSQMTLAVSGGTICKGNCISLSAQVSGGYPPYTYQWQPVNQSTPSITVCPTVTTVYTLTLTDSSGAVVIKTATVTVPISPVINISTTSSTCGTKTGSATAAASGGSGPYTYVWNPGNINGPTANGLASGTYTVTVTDGKGCTSTKIAVVINSLSFTNITTVPCFGDSTGSATAVMTGTAPYTYNWSCGQTNSQATGLPAGTYTVVIIDNTGCSAQGTVVITQPSKLVCGTGSVPVNCLGSNTGSAFVIVSGGSPPYTYTWTGGGNASSLSNVGVGTYKVKIVDKNGCMINDSVSVKQAPDPAPVFLCPDTAGCAPFCIKLFCPDTTMSSYTWKVGGMVLNGNPQNPCLKTPGIYSVSLSVVDKYGCKGSVIKTGLITVWPSPVADFTASRWSASTGDPVVSFFDKSSGADSLQWYFPDDGSYSVMKDPVHTFTDTGCHQVRLIAKNSRGCSDTASKEVCIKGDYQIWFPNTFTPNGDNMNDVFLPMGIGIDPNHFKMFIFDRWGDLIYTTSDLKRGWNGIANDGKEIAQQDVYVWKVQTRDYYGRDHQYIGHVNLVR